LFLPLEMILPGKRPGRSAAARTILFSEAIAFESSKGTGFSLYVNALK